MWSVNTLRVGESESRRWSRFAPSLFVVASASHAIFKHSSSALATTHARTRLRHIQSPIPLAVVLTDDVKVSSSPIFLLINCCLSNVWCVQWKYVVVVEQVGRSVPVSSAFVLIPRTDSSLDRPWSQSCLTSQRKIFVLHSPIHANKQTDDSSLTWLIYNRFFVLINFSDN